MNIRSRFLSIGVVIAATCLLSFSSLAQQNDRIALGFEEKAIVVSGFPRGSEVALFGVAHEARGYSMRLIDFGVVLSDEDRDGQIRYDIQRIVPPQSVWVAVSVRTGKSAVASPGGESQFHRRPLPAPALQRRKPQEKAGLAYPHEFLIVWFVRPGTGAWSHAARNGAAGAGQSDNAVTAKLEDFTRLGQSPSAPDDFKPNDLIFAIDPIHLDLLDATFRND